MKFVLYFGNRGFFPGELVASARREMSNAVIKSGNEFILMDEKLTKYGAVETVDDGIKYAEFLKQNEGKFDGVVMCLPNFSDENGAVPALRDANVPILIQAYPDEIGKMSFEQRRDSYCGKLSIMDMFNQYGIPFTVFKPHVINPTTELFNGQLKKFANICRVVKGMKRFKIGAIGARTTLFKTVRYDEMTLQKYGITIETLDLSELFFDIKKVPEDGIFEKEKKTLINYSNFSAIKSEKIDLLTKTLIALKNIIKNYKLDALSLRCWNEFELQLGIAPCVIVSYLNNMGIACSCELDVTNAIVMRMFTLASGNDSACLDWNNNYGEEKDKCILFHCGPVAQSLMKGKGRVTDHKMFAKSYGIGSGAGSNEGRIDSFDFTFGSSKTENGKLYMYLGTGRFTDDIIESEFFGCGGVAEIKNLDDVVMYTGKNSYKHHTSITKGIVDDEIYEAATTYLNYDIIRFN